VQTQTFSPDDIYCVYCHARAAGPCAVCGALCCPDCVELVMGLTARRAVCLSCLQKGEKPAGHGVWRWLVAALLLFAAAVISLAVALSRVRATAALACNPELPANAHVITAIYAPDPTCDSNNDGAVSAADITGAILQPFPTPTPSVHVTVYALNNQWETCETGSVCDSARIAA
jgi:hypothetical protein